MTNGNTTEAAKPANATEQAGGPGTTQSAAEPTVATEQATHRAGDSTSCSATTTTGTTEEIDPSFHSVDFNVHVSMRYHQARRAWWTALSRLSSAAGALAGSAAIIAALGNAKAYWAYVSATSGAFAALNLALGFTERAREHTTLYDKFSNIASRMVAELSQDSSAARKYKAEILLVEASEPPSIHTLNVICHNQECEARNDKPVGLRRVYLINRIFKSWGTIIDHFPPTEEPDWIGKAVNSGLLLLLLLSIVWYFGLDNIYEEVKSKFTLFTLPPVRIND